MANSRQDSQEGLPISYTIPENVDLLLVYPPKLSLSKHVNSLKGISSRLLREARPELSGK